MIATETTENRHEQWYSSLDARTRAAVKRSPIFTSRDNKLLQWVRAEREGGRSYSSISNELSSVARTVGQLFYDWYSHTLLVVERLERLDDPANRNPEHTNRTHEGENR